jgi:hypothetical protein
LRASGGGGADLIAAEFEAQRIRLGLPMHDELAEFAFAWGCVRKVAGCVPFWRAAAINFCGLLDRLAPFGVSRWGSQ